MHGHPRELSAARWQQVIPYSGENVTATQMRSWALLMQAGPPVEILPAVELATCAFIHPFLKGKCQDDYHRHFSLE
jgi:hypothetical protein